MTLPELESLRIAINDVDHKLLELVAERVRLVLEVGDVKRRHDLPVYDPAREREVLQRLASEAPTPLDEQTVRRIFERVIDESRRLEKAHINEP